MEYFIKASAVIALFYICYKLFLQKETFFQSNRWFLLIGLIVAIVFPFVVIPEYVFIESINISQDNAFVGIPITTDLPIIEEKSSFDYKVLIPILYGIGVMFFFIRFLLQFGSLILLLIKNPKNKDGIYTYIIVKNDISPFSFFKWIVYNPKQFNTKELQLILNHERVHVRQYHSIDIIITQFVSVLFWFNPFIWLYKKDVHQNLEYIADDLAQTINRDEKTYQKLLLKTSVANYDTALTNNFYNSLIKKRIVMLHKSKSKTIKKWKIAIVLPLLAILLMSVNREMIFVEKENSLVSNVEKGESLEFIVTKNTTENELNSIIKSVKEKGGALRFSKIKRNSQGELTSIFVSFYNYNYSTSAQNKAIDSFIIYKELFGNEGGYVGRINAATMHFKDNDKATDNSIKKLKKRAEKAIIKNGIQNQDDLKKTFKKGYTLKSLTSEMIEIIFTKNTTEESFKKHKKFLKEKNASFKVKQLERNDKGEISSINIDFITKNGTANHSVSNNSGIPINDFKFYMKDDGEFGVKDLNSNNQQGYFKIRHPQDKNPLYVVDGKVVDQETYKKLKEENIKTINVLKDKAAIDTYGQKAKNGVVVITSKNNNNIRVNNSSTTIDKATIKNVIQNNNKSDRINASEISNSTRLNFSQNELPLYVVDGEIVDEEVFNKLKNEDIQTINVLKDKATTDLYSKKAKYGVVVVRTKKNTTPVYILNGKVITEAQVKKLEATDRIKNLEVIHHKKELIKEKYNIDTDGDVIIIETKEGNKQSAKPEAQQEISENQKNQKLYITSGSVTSNANYGGIIVNSIHKKTDDESFKRLTANYAKDDINLQFSSILRNENQEITSITISMKNTITGKFTSASFNEDDGIPKIFIGYTGPVNNKITSD